MYAEQKADIVPEITNNYNKINKMTSAPKENNDVPIQKENQVQMDESEESLFSLGEYHFVKKYQKIDERKIRLSINRQVRLWEIGQLYKNSSQNQGLVMFFYQVMRSCLQKLLSHCLGDKNRRQKFQNLIQKCAYKIQDVFNIIRNRQNQLNLATDQGKLENIVRYLKIVKDFLDHQKQSEKLKFIKILLNKQGEQLKQALIKKITQVKFIKESDQQVYSQDSFDAEKCRNYRVQHTHPVEQLLSDAFLNKLRKRLLRLKNDTLRERLLNNFNEVFPQENNKEIRTTHKQTEEYGGTSSTYKHDFNIFHDVQNLKEQGFLNEENVKMNKIKPQNQTMSNFLDKKEQKIQMTKQKQKN